MQGSDRRAAEGALVEALDQLADLVPVPAAGQPVDLPAPPRPLLGAASVRERAAAAPEERIFLKCVHRHRRAGLEVTPGQLHANDLVRLQVDDGGTRGDAERGAVVAEEGQLGEAEVAAEL